MGSERWRRDLLGLSIGQAMTALGFSFVIPFFPLYVQTLGVRGTAESAQWAAAVISASAVAMAISQPVWGSLADRWGRKPMLLRSMLGGSIAVLLMGLVSSPQQLIALRLCQGAVGGTVAATNTLAAASVPRQLLGFALGLMQVSIFIGLSTGPLMGGAIADRWGYRIPFFAGAALIMVGFLAVLGLVQENFTRPEANSPRLGLWKQGRSLLATSLFPVLIAVVFLIQLGGIIVSPVLSLFVAELGGSEGAATAAGLVFASTGAMSAISALILGRLGDRIGHSVILSVCLAGAALSYFPQAVVQQVWQLFLLRALLGVFLGGLMPSVNALLAALVPPERRGATFGISGAANSLANAVGPLTGAAITTYLGMRAIFVATGVLFVLAYCWLSLMFRRSRLVAPPGLVGDHAN